MDAGAVEFDGSWLSVDGQVGDVFADEVSESFGDGGVEFDAGGYGECEECGVGCGGEVDVNLVVVDVQVGRAVGGFAAC